MFLKSNIKILNRFGNDYDNLQLITSLNETSIPKDNQSHPNYYSYSALMLTKQIEHDTNLKLDAFNYLRINAIHQQIELSFISSREIFNNFFFSYNLSIFPFIYLLLKEYDISGVPERLSNNLNYQAFAEKNFYLQDVNASVDFSSLKHENCSIRFVVHATHLIVSR